MKKLLQFTLPLVALIGIPVLFNSCQNGILGTGFLAKRSSCKLGLEKGIVTKLEFDHKVAPKPFAASKVQLGESNTTPAGQMSKATSAPELNAGTRLGVILDNVCLQEKAAQSAISQAALASGERHASLFRQAYQWELDRTYTAEEIQALADQDTCVIGVTWNQDYKLQTTSFNDSRFPDQTHMATIRAQDAYDYFYGVGRGMAPSGATNVQIAVVDTGVDWNHPDIKSNMWVHNNGVGIDITTLGSNPNLINYNPFDVSDIGHGTHVSGLIGAVANNSEGVVGAMPWRAKLMGIKVFRRDGSGNLSTTSTYLYNGMQFAYLNGANVINLSLGSVSANGARDPMAEAGLDEALQRGVVVVTVIGNADSGNGVNIDGTNMTAIPGIYSAKPGVLGVGSIDASTGEKSDFSHYSTTFAEIAAPGAQAGTTGLYSTLPTAMASYGRLKGTSQAAPLVAAAAGLTIGLIKNSYAVGPTPAEVERLILSSAMKTASLNSYFKEGNKLDLLNLVQKINADYPATRTGSVVAASDSCP